MDPTSKIEPTPRGPSNEPKSETKLTQALLPALRAITTAVKSNKTPQLKRSLQVLYANSMKGPSIPILAISNALSFSALGWILSIKSFSLSFLQNMLIVKSILDLAKSASVPEHIIETTTQSSTAIPTATPITEYQERISTFSFIIANLSQALINCKQHTIAPGISSTLSYILIASAIHKQLNSTPHNTITTKLQTLALQTGYTSTQSLFADMKTLTEFICPNEIQSSELANILSLANKELHELSTILQPSTPPEINFDNHINTVNNLNVLLQQIKSELVALNKKDYLAAKVDIISSKVQSINSLIDKAQIIINSTTEIDKNRSHSKPVTVVDTKTGSNTSSQRLNINTTSRQDTTITQPHQIAILSMPQPTTQQSINTDEDEEEQEHEEKEEPDEDQKEDQKQEKEEKKDPYTSSSVTRWKFAKE